MRKGLIIIKGIILAAGKGTRLYPITIPVCKPLLPMYDKPLIYYSLAAQMKAGIRDILIIVPPGEVSTFNALFGDGSNIGIHVEYKEQLVQRGIADAFIVGEEFIGTDSVCLALADNIFFGPDFDQKVRSAAKDSLDGATIFGYYVDDPRPFGVVEFDKSGRAISIEEKPQKPKSNYIVPGLYFYDNDVVRIAAKVKPSARGELEITAVNNEYLNQGKLQVISLGKEYSWYDAGTADSLLIAANAIQSAQKSGKMLACLDEIALQNKWISESQLEVNAEKMRQTKYGQYLKSLLND